MDLSFFEGMNFGGLFRGIYLSLRVSYVWGLVGKGNLNRRNYKHHFGGSPKKTHPNAPNESETNFHGLKVNEGCSEDPVSTNW